MSSNPQPPAIAALVDEVQRRMYDTRSSMGSCQKYYDRYPHAHCSNDLTDTCDDCLVSRLLAALDHLSARPMPNSPHHSTPDALSRRVAVSVEDARHSLRDMIPEYCEEDSRFVMEALDRYEHAILAEVEADRQRRRAAVSVECTCRAIEPCSRCVALDAALKGTP